MIVWGIKGNGVGRGHTFGKGEREHGTRGVGGWGYTGGEVGGRREDREPRN